MGTNYYLSNNHCECCKRYDRAIHLGKSSGGWTFTFRGYRQSYPEDYSEQLNVQTFEEWCELIERKMADDGYHLIDEYGKKTTKAELFALVEAKRDEPNNHAAKFRDSDNWLDMDGNSFSGNEFC